MNMTFRWYGRDNDTVTLEQVKQIPNVKGIVWALHRKPVGEVWETDEIKSEVEYIKSFGFHADVVESVNIHESIKLGNNERDLFIENYKKTIRNLGEFGVKVICYNFMPVFDWTRTDLYRSLPDGSTALFYEKNKVEELDPQDLIKTVSEASDLTLPGWEPEKMSRIQELFAAYQHVSAEDLWENLRYFLQEILPVAEEAGIKMAIHPDDPPWSIFGLPRIMTGDESLQKLLSISDSPSNGITFCTGSLGANPQNDMVELARKFAERSPFAHIRNVKIFENGDFIETSHLTADGSINIKGVVKELSEIQYEGYVRPDHGRHLWGEECRPGYGLYDRALGIMYLHGLWDAYQSEK
ncbi:MULTISPECIES: mannonate dehydratase [Cytobacillus]|jgi:mannonate dehydratase|uniref:Mannonate dehydratase n=3 Tax=Cytobacillus TaxID=2675230 RepID=A0A160MGM9_9BACI|nr:MULTISPECIES: mannonate dehydratase [Cytobacillus]MCS0826567.1 mannonate dehydratase [Cytobacillus firmus]AND42476.1 mannonate dehydratase [Cytobacillus oceanisediminis 2691]MCM3243914.1 mannonate dehydratase [Cytobacillus oceanisediminis]OHX42614.1 mannonate dehydratase [Cytobacillus oceanisediminis]USK44212.1 mannonate dehydratase [Cytobacillus oceanisediminis]